MPTTYTPDPTATQAPSAQPDPDNFPLCAIPNAAEGATVASISQFIKAMADQIAWLKAPRAKVNSYLQALRTHKSARLHVRSYVDHLGFPMQQAISMDQNWDGFPSFPLVATPDRGWYGDPGSGSITNLTAARSGAVTSPLFNVAVISPQTSSITQSVIQRYPTCMTVEDLKVSLKWSAAFDTLGTNRTTAIMGFTGGMTSGGSITPVWGAYFTRASGGTVWNMVVNGSVTASAVTPSVNVYDDFRIDLIGANVSDDGNSKIIFYINNAVALNLTHAINGLQLDTAPLFPTFLAATTTTGGAAVKLGIGPVRYRQITAVNSY